MERSKKVQLSARLQALADLVTPGSRVADIGCDHGFLSVYLVEQGISPKAVASDVREGPLSRAKEHIAERGLEAYIETRLADGLLGLRAGEADTLVCAGMGGRLMQKILTEGGDVAKSAAELILQPQSELEEFRRFLRAEGYRIVQEDIICEDGKYYFMMKALPSCGQGGEEGQDEIPERLADKYGGLLLRGKHPVLKEYLLFLRGTYSSVAEEIRGRPASGALDNSRTGQRLAQVRAELDDIGEALCFYAD